MQIQHASPAHSPAPQQREADRLRYACREVEGMFVGLLMKEGLKGIIEGEDDDERPVQFQQLMEFTVEETARQLGHQGAIGLADSLLQQLLQT